MADVVFSGNPARPWYVPSQTPQNRLGNPGPGRPGFSKMGGKGTGRDRSASVAGGLVGTGGKFRGWGFLVCWIARVFSAGFPKRGAKTPRFLPIMEPRPAGLQRPCQELQPASPIYEGCARMNPVGPRTGFLQPPAGVSQKGNAPRGNPAESRRRGRPVVGGVLVVVYSPNDVRFAPIFRWL